LGAPPCVGWEKNGFEKKPGLVIRVDLGEKNARDPRGGVVQRKDYSHEEGEPVKSKTPEEKKPNLEGAASEKKLVTRA